jgi:hypothetical protein
MITCFREHWLNRLQGQQIGEAFLSPPPPSGEREGPLWVNSRNLRFARNVPCSLPELTFGLLPRSAKRRHSRLINRDFAKALYGMCFEAPQDL